MNIQGCVSCFVSKHVHAYKRMSSSETAAGVRTPRSVNKSVMCFGGV